MITHPKSQYKVQGTQDSFYIYDSKAESKFIKWFELRPTDFHKVLHALANSKEEFDRVCAELIGDNKCSN